MQMFPGLDFRIYYESMFTVIVAMFTGNARSRWFIQIFLIAIVTINAIAGRFYVTTTSSHRTSRYHA